MQALDSFNIRACDALKIDVEGYELPVLQGAAGTLTRCRPFIIMEVHEVSWLRHQIHKEAASEFLLGLGARLLGSTEVGSSRLFGWEEK